MSLWDDEPPQDQLWTTQPRELTDEEREDFWRILEASGSRPYDPDEDDEQ